MNVVRIELTFHYRWRMGSRTPLRPRQVKESNPHHPAISGTFTLLGRQDSNLQQRLPKSRVLPIELPPKGLNSPCPPTPHYHLLRDRAVEDFGQNLNFSVIHYPSLLSGNVGNSLAGQRLEELYRHYHDIFTQTRRPFRKQSDLLDTIMLFSTSIASPPTSLR